MNNRTKTTALAIAAAMLQGAFVQPAFSRTDLKGEAVEAPDGARVIEINPATRWVNVERNRTVVFVANGHRFGWRFNTLQNGTDFELSGIAPPDFGEVHVRVYVAPSMDYLG